MRRRAECGGGYGSIHLGLASALTEIGPAELDRCFFATRILLAAWCVVSSLEWLSNRAVFDDYGLLSWNILSLRSVALYRLKLPNALVSSRAIVCLLSLRIAAAVLLALGVGPAWAMLALIILTSLILKLRTWLGEDGADQMGHLVSIGALAMAVGMALPDRGLALAGVVLIAGQLTISYFFAGYTKLLSSDWRNGSAVVGVMGTHSYGHDAAAAVLGASAAASVAACWAVMVPEALFPLALIAPPLVCWAALAVFAAFHVATAVFMGLNTFVWAFLSAYPATILLNLMIARALGWT